jgi:hypothetical protein
MKRITCIIILISFFNFIYGQKIGKYYGSNGKGSNTLILNKDNSYNQLVQDCTYGFFTSGIYNIKNDTIILTAKETFWQHGSKKRTPFKDTSDYVFKLTARMSKYLIRHDTIVQLKKYNISYIETTTLKKTKK